MKAETTMSVDALREAVQLWFERHYPGSVVRTVQVVAPATSDSPYAAPDPGSVRVLFELAGLQPQPAERACPDCGGSGDTHTDHRVTGSCARCNGTGFVAG
jgi:hypothetical protein